MSTFSGQTNGNSGRIVQGQYDEPLNEMGMRQAHEAGKALKSTIFHKAISSDLKRAHKTCQSVLDGNDGSPIKSKDIQTNLLLRERSFGIYENIPVDDYIKVTEAAGFESMYDFVPEKGESRDDVAVRAKDFLAVSDFQLEK